MPGGAPERAVLGSSIGGGCVSALHELEDRRAVLIVHRHRAVAHLERTDVREELEVTVFGALLILGTDLHRRGDRTERDLARGGLVGRVIRVASGGAADRAPVELRAHRHLDGLGLAPGGLHLRQDPRLTFERGGVLGAAVRTRPVVVVAARGEREGEHHEREEREPAQLQAGRSWRWRLGVSLTGTSVGFTLLRTTSSSITHLVTSWREGSSYIVLSRTSSMIARSPRAPVARRIAWSAIASSEPSVNSSSTPSNSKNLWYWRTSAFFGLVRMSTSAGLSRLWTLVMTGSRPTNSGINPYLRRSSGSTWPRIRPMSLSSPPRTSAPTPTPGEPIRLSTIFSKPANAPPQMNSTLVVSIWMNSWCGCLRPPCAGTDAVVPSRVFWGARWTPSPETSRVIEGFSDLRAILSTSSM